MREYESISHVRWDCKYHIVLITKYRHKKIYEELRKKVGRIIRKLCEQKGLELHEGQKEALEKSVRYCREILGIKNDTL